MPQTPHRRVIFSFQQPKQKILLSAKHITVLVLSVLDARDTAERANGRQNSKNRFRTFPYFAEVEVLLYTGVLYKLVQIS